MILRNFLWWRLCWPRCRRPSATFMCFMPLEGFSWEETAQVLGRPADELQEMFRQVSREVSETLRQGEGKVTTQLRNVQA